ncbi:MAG TPA: efflux RND transporter permease subunit [Tenuifilum sp.]|uniref:efflux RND transporter permease subunit n=1 Tax=Tenuifilum sp. TaxID=2760880 RepID=UPI002CE3FB03|nr:efflux RND transporter permease subunit [Tenuifilum sp.]
MKLPQVAVKRPVFTAMLFVAILLFGVVSLTRLPLDIMPEMELPTLTVITVYPGASADEVEEQVSKKLEKILSGTEHLKEITSQSKENVSFVQLQFEWGTDITSAANNARDLIELVKNKLPRDAHNPIIFKVNSSLMPVLVYGVTANESYNGLYKIVDDEVASKLRKVPGVGSVIVIGAPEREIKVDIDPVKLHAYNLSLNQVATVLKAQNISIPGGNIKVGNDDYSVRIPGDIASVDELRDMALISFNGKVIRLSDVAEVRDEYKEKDDVGRTTNGKGVTLMVQKQSGENTLEVVKKIRKKVAEIKPALPSDVSITEVMKSDELITESINNLSESLWYALFFVVLVVMAFLRNWKQSFIIFITIPFSLIVAFIVMFASGWTINIFSLMSLVVASGMVVDNAIVVLENITQHIEKGAKPKQAAIFGSSEMGMAISASTLTTIVVFLPMIFMGGIVGIMFKQLAILTSVTLIASLFTALTLTPMASSQMLEGMKKNEKRRHGKLFEWSERMFQKLENGYKKALAWVVHHKTFTVIVTVALLAFSLWVGKGLGTDYIPEFDAGDVVAVIETEVGTSTTKTDSVAQVVMQIFQDEIPEMVPGSLASISGQTEEGLLSSVGFSEGKNIATVMCHLSKPNERKHSAKQIADRVRPRIAAIPEVENFRLLGGSIISAAVTGNKKPIEIEVSGNSFGSINSTAEAITARMRQSKYFSDVINNVDKGKLEVQIRVDKRKASAMGLNSAMIGLQVRQSIYGTEAGEFKEEGDEYDITLRYSPENRNDINQIRNIQLKNLLNQTIPLSAVAEVEMGTSPLQINRKGQQRVVKVMAELNDVSLGDAHKEAKRILAGLDIPSDVTVEIAGQTTDQGESFGDLYLILALGVLLVYMVMASQFESFRDPFIIMFAVPVTFIGVIWAFKLIGLTLSITTFVGLIMLMGIVVNNGIVLVDYTNLLRKRGYKLYDAIAEAGRSRLRPVLMTTFTTLLGMVPMATSSGMGREAYSPLGITMISGLLVSTLITLLLVPTIYAIFHDNERKAEVDTNKSVLFN